MTNPVFLLGAPIDYKGKFNIYPPTIKQVATQKHFWQWFKILTMSQEEVEDELVNKVTDGRFPTPFELLLVNSYHNQEYAQLAKEAFQCFIGTPVTFLYEKKLIIVGDLEKLLPTIKSIDDLIVIAEEEFFDFQNIIRQSLGVDVVEPPNPDEDPRIKRIKAKARYRDKIKAKKGLGLKLETCIASICCMGFGLNPLNIGEMSYAAVDLLMHTYQEKEKYETDVRSLQAGADSKKIKPKYWIRNLTD